MSNGRVGQHCYDRLSTALSADAKSVTKFITKDTYIDMKPFSFEGHEYQGYVARLVESNLVGLDLSIEKCSQTGLSELVHRVMLALMANIPSFSTLLALPSRTFAIEVVKTRISQIIDQSPRLKSMVNRKVDSALVKQFLNGSIVYALGAGPQSEGSIISRPADLAICDELDRMDIDLASGFRSRMTHSPYKSNIKISTPTAPDFGINAEADNKQLHQQLVRCHSCRHEYIPDYFEQMVLPGLDDPIATLTPTKYHTLGLNVHDAFHVCPNCHNPSKLGPEHRFWDVQNKQKHGIHVRLTPFDAPDFISNADLVQSQLDYRSYDEFRQQGLGLTSELKNSSIDMGKIKFTRDETPSTGLQIAGMDLGKTSHFMKGVLLRDDVIFVDHIDLIPVGRLQSTVCEKFEQGRIVSMVSDSLPYQDTVFQLTEKFAQFWGAVYLNPVNPSPELYRLKIDKEEGVRQVNIQKNLMFDRMVDMLMNEKIIFKSGPHDEALLKHLGDMRKVRDYRYVEEKYTWVKSSKGEDHLFHTLAYLVTASRLVTKGIHTGVPVPIPGITPFKTKSDL